MTYDERFKDIIDRLTEAARAELDATDAGRFKRIKICCEHAEDLLRETAQSVEDFEALEDDEDGVLFMLGELKPADIPELAEHWEVEK